MIRVGGMGRDLAVALSIAFALALIGCGGGSGGNSGKAGNGGSIVCPRRGPSRQPSRIVLGLRWNQALGG